MALIEHNVDIPNSGNGDELRKAFVNQNSMNSELYETKVDKVLGKDLSDQNYTIEEKNKLLGIEEGAEVNVQPDWLQSDDTADDYIKNKPSISGPTNTSELVNDGDGTSAFITFGELPGLTVTSVNGQTGDVVLDANDVGAIPITGTEVGSPVTGSIEVTELVRNFWVKGGNYPDNYNFLSFSEGGISLNSKDEVTGKTSSILINDNNIIIDAEETIGNMGNSQGIRALKDFTPNLTDLSYPQKIYVDTKLANSTTPVTPVLADKMIIKDVSDSNNSKEITLTDLQTLIVNTEATTGAVISFAKPQVYNTSGSPTSSNITNDLTSAKIGIVQKIYSNKSTEPTYPVGWVKIGTGNYTNSVLNIIFAEWCGGSRVEYWITKPA